MLDAAEREATSTVSPAPRPGLQAWPLIVGLALMAAPTVQTLAHQDWSRESGAHGPIVLATGGWLLWREAPALRRLGVPGSLWGVGLILALSLPVYVIGRMLDLITLEAGGVYGAGLAVLFSAFGLRALLKTWFPLAYLAFAVPPPTWLMDHLTAPLKQFVSGAATGVLHFAGLPVAREGVTIMVAQYQLLVEDACSGMNSLVGLTAISLLYIYLLRGSNLRYSVLLTLFVIPIAIAGNILRVMTLILMTYFFGDQVAQGFLHFAAGIFLFCVDLLLVFGVDMVLARTLPRSWRPA